LNTPKIRPLLLACLGFLLSGCSLFDIANLAAPDEGYSERQDIPYGDLPRQRLDVYLPDPARRKDITLVYFYGGGWRSGNRAQYRFVGRRLAAAGYNVVLPDYRLYPAVTFPAFVEDGARAVAALLGPLGQSVDLSGPVYLVGHSAGGHIAMLLALDDRYLAAEGVSTNALAGVIGIAGPYDFLPFTSSYMHDIFPGEEARAASQPVNFVDRGDPRVLLLHGDNDRRVWTRNSMHLHTRLVMSGVESTLKIYPDVSHGGILLPLVGIDSSDNSLLEDIEIFVSGMKKPDQ
jgi:acetyl esterase/lipase